MADAAEPPVTYRRVFLVASASQGTAQSQVESLCRAQGVKCRISAEIGRRTTVLVLDLRGAADGVATAVNHIEIYLNAQADAPARAGLPRAVVGAVSFFAGLVLTLLVFLLISR